MQKIDRTFVATMTRNPHSMTPVCTIISLAHALDLKVIAEGVESEEQVKLLRLPKCDEMQGYLFSKRVATFSPSSATPGSYAARSSGRR